MKIPGRVMVRQEFRRARSYKVRRIRGKPYIYERTAKRWTRIYADGRVSDDTDPTAVYWEPMP